MNFNKILIAYVIFGCWLKQLYNPIASLGYNIWLVLAAFWIILNLVGMITFLFKGLSAREKRFLDELTADSIDRWLGMSILAITSYLFCGEELVALFFLIGPFGFLFATLYNKEMLAKKKKSK